MAESFGVMRCVPDRLDRLFFMVVVSQDHIPPQRATDHTLTGPQRNHTPNCPPDHRKLNRPRAKTEMTSHAINYLFMPYNDK